MRIDFDRCLAAMNEAPPPAEISFEGQVYLLKPIAPNSSASLMDVAKVADGEKPDVVNQRVLTYLRGVFEVPPSFLPETLPTDLGELERVTRIGGVLTAMYFQLAQDAQSDKLRRCREEAERQIAEQREGMRIAR